jgi:thiol:disulfide interchange protein DsbA
MRVFSRFFSILLLALTWGCAQAGVERFNLGTEYKTVRNPQAATDLKRVSVEEFFWYGCPHCFHAEGNMKAWEAKKAADIDFLRMPNSLGRPEGEVHARAFYVAQTLKVFDKIHSPLFAAIHEQRQTINTVDAMKAFFNQKAGIAPAKYEETAKSFAVDKAFKAGELRAMQYGIASVPTIVVGGKYTCMATEPNVGEIINFLVAKVRAERKR